MNAQRYYTGLTCVTMPGAVAKLLEYYALRMYEHDVRLRTIGAGYATSQFRLTDKSRAMRPIIYASARVAACDDNKHKAPSLEAFKVADAHTLRFRSLATPARATLAGAVNSVLGHDLQTPSLAVLCYRPDSASANLACKVAKANAVPVFDFSDSDAKANFSLFMQAAYAIRV